MDSLASVKGLYPNPVRIQSLLILLTVVVRLIFLICFRADFHFAILLPFVGFWSWPEPETAPVGVPGGEQMPQIDRTVERPSTQSMRKSSLMQLLCLLLMCFTWSAFGAEVEYLTNEWSLNTGTSSQTCPAIAPDGTIYFGTFTGRFWAVGPEGSLKWIFRAGLEIKSSPAIGADGTIYFGSRDRKCYAVRPDGKKKWEFRTGGWVDSSPALASDGMVCFGSWDNTFYAVNPDGKARWHFSTAGPIVSSPAIGANGTIYFGSHDDKFYALASDGTKQWEYAVGGPIISSPAISQEGVIYFTSVDGSCYALNSDGKMKWRVRTGGITESSPVIGLDGIVYVGVNKQLWAITPDGKKKWDRNVEDLIQPTPLILADGSICFESGWGVMLNIAPDLTFNWIFPGVSRAPPAVSPTGEIYVTDAIRFIAVQNKYPLGKSPWPKFRGNSRNTGNVKDRPQ
jgi:outer membrane protein assembly factor BamB